jgi:dCTP deaminase
MILSDVDIKKYLRKDKIRITPTPSEEQIGPASVDLTLSNEFWRVKKFKEIDLLKTKLKDASEKFIASTVKLKAGEIILGKTVERITLPNNICGRLEGRSSFARLGLAVHVTSGFIQPGSDNHQILEIVNLAPYSIAIKSGMRISQVIFEETRTATSKPYAKFGKLARKQ